jgi:NAD(P)-dependent dehydrogenase (short-subunit alcohol dehydrogenase family)
LISADSSPDPAIGFNGRVPTAGGSKLNFIGTASPDAARLARALVAEPTLACPETPAADSWSWDWANELTAWQAEVEALPPAERVVVCTWSGAVPAVPLVDLAPTEWRRHVEWPTALWFSTLVAAASRCADGGSLVAVVDRPAALDAIRHSAAVTLADGVANVVRSLAAGEGERGVRVNAVITSLPSLPGRVEVEVAGAVRMLLSDDAAGLTGTTVTATGGRA